MAVITVSVMAKRLDISTAAVKMRLSRKGREPYDFIGSAGIYTEADFEAIKDGGKRGRPYPESKQEKAPKKTTKKNPKKT